MRKSHTFSNIRTRLLIVYLALTFSLFNIDNFLKSQVYGHDFVPNESASFLSFANQLQAESELVQSNLDNDNLTLAKEHATRAIELLNSKDPINNVAWRDEIAERNQRVANELVTAISNLENITVSPEQQQSANLSIVEIDAILNEAITARIEQEQRENSTIRALALANLVDSILRNYGDAYDVGFDLTNMSNMAGSSSPMMMGNDTDGNYSLVNTSDYQSARALAIKAQEIFESELRSLAPDTATGSIGQLENGLIQLIDAVNNRASPTEVMMIVHTQVHPSLQSAFNLGLQMQM